MKSIRKLMTGKHRQCDKHFVAVEQAVSRLAWGEPDLAVNDFRGRLLASQLKNLVPQLEDGINMSELRNESSQG